VTEVVTFTVDARGWFPLEPERSAVADTHDTGDTLTGTYVPTSPTGPLVRISASGSDAVIRARRAAIVVASQIQQGADLLLALGCVADPEDLRRS
jgi:hypothetical protein